MRARGVCVVLAARRLASGARPASSRPHFKARTTLPPAIEAVLQQPPAADDPRAARTLAAWFADKSNVVVLTGAGLSTDSGIPDYRGRDGSYRKGHTPVSHDEFLRDSAARTRYWARALVGYGAFRDARPNAAHAALAALEARGTVRAVITQNVDGLHEAAGSTAVIPLHGRGYRVRCVACGAESCRGAYHEALAAANPGFDLEARREDAEAFKALRPDADADVADFSGFDTVVPCARCGGGTVKPDVTFFGDNVPRARVDACHAALDGADGLLCAGTSLAVYSAFRFVRAASGAGIPICVLNRGRTRADVENIDALRVNAGVGALADALPDS